MTRYRLGLAYLQGVGVPADAGRACQWFRQAAEQGNIDATLAMGAMCCCGRGVAESEERNKAPSFRGIIAGTCRNSEICTSWRFFLPPVV